MLGEMFLGLPALPWLRSGRAGLVSRPISLSVPLCCVLQIHGFVLYRTQLPWDVLDPATLGAPPHSICDRGYVMLQKVRLWGHSHPASWWAVGSTGSRAMPCQGLGDSQGAESDTEPLWGSPLA